jgi:hypothetical protein
MSCIWGYSYGECNLAKIFEHLQKPYAKSCVAKVFRKIAMFVFDKMKQLELNVQQVIIEKFLAHPLMQNMLLDHLIYNVWRHMKK